MFGLTFFETAKCTSLIKDLKVLQNIRVQRGFEAEPNLGWLCFQLDSI